MIQKWQLNKTWCLLLRYSLSSKEARYITDNEKKQWKNFYVIQSSLGTQRLWLKLGVSSYYHDFFSSWNNLNITLIVLLGKASKLDIPISSLQIIIVSIQKHNFSEFCRGPLGFLHVLLHFSSQGWRPSETSDQSISSLSLCLGTACVHAVSSSLA